MAPLPKRRHSTRRGGKRKASIKYALPTLVRCKQCQTLTLPHRVCRECGYYDGRVVVVKNPSASLRARKSDS